MTFKYPLATDTWGNEEIAAIERIVRSKRFTMGECVREFEAEFAKYVGSKYCVMVNSGSSANLLMIAALFYTSNPRLRLKRGDEVIVPAVSWSTSYYPLYQYGLKLRFVDVDLLSLNYDLEKLSSAVTDKTKLLMVVNLLGNPNDFNALKQIINHRNIVMIEDNCESMGAVFEGRQAGTFGVMGSFSTYFSHHISTIEGGMIVTDDEELYHILLSLRAHGWTRQLPKINHVIGQKQEDPFYESFHFVLPGYNVRPTELQAAIGLEQLKRLPEIINMRRRNAKDFASIFVNHPSILIQKEIGQSSWFGFSMIVRPNSNLSRHKLLKVLELKGFETRPIVAGNFTRNPVIKYFDYEIADGLKNADYIHYNGCFIGNHGYSCSAMMKDLEIVAEQC